MNILRGLRQFFGGSSSSVAGMMQELGFPSTTSYPVSTQVALQASAIVCGARVIAEGVAQCPLKLYSETNDGARAVRTPAREHELYDLVAYAPCFLTSFEFLEQLTMHAVIEGNGYAVKNRGGKPGGRVLELIPVMPNEVDVIWNEFEEPAYRIPRIGQVLPKSEVLHLRGPAWDALVGKGVRELARETIGLSKAMEKSQGDLYSKGARPSGILSGEGVLSADAMNALKASWKAAYGPGGPGGIAILDNGMKFHPMAMTAVDSQYVETRKFLIEEAARALRVFPQMLMHSDKTATFASASEFFQAHVVHTLLPWITRWEAVIKRDLVGFADVDIWPRFTLDALLRGNPSERAAYYREMVMLGVMSPNEVREKENLNPRDGGDEYLTPLNMRIGAGDGVGDEKNPAKSAQLRAI